MPERRFTWRVTSHDRTRTVHAGRRAGRRVNVPYTTREISKRLVPIYLPVSDAQGRHYGRARHSSAQVFSPSPAPAGLSLRLDGQTVATPLTFDAVVGITRSVEAPTPQSSGTTSYEFASWSDGGAAAHTISTPSANTTYTATYRPGGGSGTGTGLNAEYFDNAINRDAARARDGRDCNGGAVLRPAAGVDTFSARWTVRREPYTGNYTFYTRATSVRLC